MGCDIDYILIRRTISIMGQMLSVWFQTAALFLFVVLIVLKALALVLKLEIYDMTSTISPSILLFRDHIQSPKLVLSFEWTCSAYGATGSYPAHSHNHVHIALVFVMHVKWWEKIKLIWEENTVASLTLNFVFCAKWHQMLALGSWI